MRFSRPVITKRKMAATSTIANGDALKGAVTGEVSRLTDGGATTAFAGIALESGVTTATDADVEIDVLEEGITELTVAGSGSSAVGTPVYASDHDSFTLTATDVCVGSLYMQTAASSTVWRVFVQGRGLSGAAALATQS